MTANTVGQPNAPMTLKAAVSIQLAHRGWMERFTAGGLRCRPLGISLVADETLVGAYGISNRMEYTALGHVVNLCSRLCGAAEAGEMLTTPHTREAALYDVPQGKGRCAFSFFSKGKMHFKDIQGTVEVIAIIPEETSHE